MTKDQVAVFIEERKWDYRGTHAHISGALLDSSCLYHSVRVYRRSRGAYPDHWADIFRL